MSDSPMAATIAHSRIPSFRRLREDEWVDAVRIVTVPRFKESDLSGDEWRTSVRVEYLRKGVVVAHESYHSIAEALGNMARHGAGFGIAPADWDEAHYGEHGLTFAEHAAQVRTLDEDFCAQPGCSEPWVNEYSQTLGTGGYRCGHVEANRYSDVRRRFCAKHSRRGDNNLDDMDSNYVLVASR